MADLDPLVVFTPSGKRGRVTKGTPVLQAARGLGVDLDSVCGGRGICSRCQVEPSFGTFLKHGITASKEALSERNSVEDRYHRLRGLAAGRRLGCQALIQDDVVIDVPVESQVHQQVVRKSPDERPVSMDPAVKLHFVEVAPPDLQDPSGDVERMCDALNDQWQIPDAIVDQSVLPDVQRVLREGDWCTTLAVHAAGCGRPTIVALWPGFFDGTVYGLAVDVGSTTIAAHLCDLRNGHVVESAGLMNPQIRFGEDLMSRVSYAMLNPGGSKEMTDAVRVAIDGLFKTLADSAGVGTDLILEAVFVCNPVMHHLLLGIDPVELGQAPFALATAKSISTAIREVGISCLPAAARAYVLPCIAGHVGADCAAVILAEQPHSSPERVLIVDVGTNAEIVFGDRNRLLACSSPTGPAFEGAQISSGQRAAPGAIERVEIDFETKVPRFRVIGCDHWSDEPEFSEFLKDFSISGICGSGIIEAIAEMRMAGLVDSSGLVGSAEQTGSERLVKDGRTHSYLLHDATDEGGSRILVTQSDVRAIQLAKSALYSGARLLMDAFGVEVVERVVLAGAFGSHISPKHAMVLGMIPDCLLEKVTSAGNAAGTGARMALCSVAARREIESVVERIEKVETAVEPKFQEHFINANSLPHAVDSYSELGKVVRLPEPNFNVTKGTARRRSRTRRS